MKWREIPTGYRDRVEELRLRLQRNPYEVLQIASDATDDEVRLAYRKAMSTYHPDRQGEFLQAYAQEVAKIVNAAYSKIQETRGDK